MSYSTTTAFNSPVHIPAFSHVVPANIHKISNNSSVGLTNMTPYFNPNALKEGTHAYYSNTALPNRNKLYNITYGMKLFKTRKSYNNALKTSDILETFNVSIPGGIVYPYTNEIKTSQLPKHLVSLLKTKNNTLKNNSTIGLVRIKKAGDSIFDYIASLNKLSKSNLKNIVMPIQKQWLNGHDFLIQCILLLKQINEIDKQGYIHGDISDKNILCDTDIVTNKLILTIIDFDWFMKKNEFENKYPFYDGYPNNPPECIIYWDVSKGNINIKNLNKDSLYSRVRTILTESKYGTLFRQFKYIQWMYDNKIAVFYDTIAKAIMNAIQSDKMTPENKNKILKTFDSYSLACVLLELLFTIYGDTVFSNKKSKHNNRNNTHSNRNNAHNSRNNTHSNRNTAHNSNLIIRKIVKEVLFPLSDINLTDRITSEDALKRLDNIQNTYIKGNVL
jgi:hypothetical protein